MDIDRNASRVPGDTNIALSLDEIAIDEALEDVRDKFFAFRGAERCIFALGLRGDECAKCTVPIEERSVRRALAAEAVDGDCVGCEFDARGKNALAFFAGANDRDIRRNEQQALNAVARR